MVDVQRIEKSALYQEMNEDNCSYWFDMKCKKFLHNIDTFYYSVKLAEDFTYESQDKKVLAFRRAVEDINKKVALKSFTGDVVQFKVQNMEEYLNVLPLHFSKYYTFCLESPEEFDIFIAPVVPGSVDGSSVTSEIIVQIRANMLWNLGAQLAFARSYEWVQAICKMYDFTILEVKENRADFCWHTNYLEQPEKFFNPDNFYSMRVDRYKDAIYHTEKTRSGEYEVDYISLGRRGGRCFIRIYNKCKEVVEKNYKPFFFKTWLFHGLINRYDLYVLEESYIKKSWKYITVARLKFYLEHGVNEENIKRCHEQIQVFEIGGKVTDKMMQLADELTPPLNLIYNIEFQLMRKATKSYVLPVTKKNLDKGPAKRVYDFFDHRKLICDYLTTDIFRLVEKTGDSNMSRRPDCGFWIALKRTKMVDVAPLSKDVEGIQRDYNRKLNAERMKQAALQKAVTYGMYIKGENDDSPVTDCMEALLRLNDNDIHNLKKYKLRKAKQLPRELLGSSLSYEDFWRTYEFHIIDGITGEFFDSSPEPWEDES